MFVFLMLCSMLVVVSVGETQLFFLEDETSATTRAVEICGTVSCRPHICYAFAPFAAALFFFFFFFDCTASVKLCFTLFAGFVSRRCATQLCGRRERQASSNCNIACFVVCFRITSSDVAQCAQVLLDDFEINVVRPSRYRLLVVGEVGISLIKTLSE